MSSNRKEDYWANLLEATKERLQEQEESERNRQREHEAEIEAIITSTITNNQSPTTSSAATDFDVPDSINPNVIHHIHPPTSEGDKHPIKPIKKVQIARRDSSGARTPERVDSKSDLSSITSKIAARLQTPPSPRRRMEDQTHTIMEIEEEDTDDSDEDDDDEDEEDELDYQPVPPFRPRTTSPAPSLTSSTTFKGDITEVHPMDARKEEKTPLIPPPLDVEDATKRTWAASLPVWIVLLCVCVSESSRGMVVPSLWPYLESMGGTTSELGYLVGIYSAGRLAGSVGLGWWFNKRGAKEALIISLVIAVAGNFLYSLANLFNSFVVLLISRLIIGFGTGLLSVGRAFVAEVTTTKERTKYISYVTAVQFIGFAITPGLGAILTHIPSFYIGAWKISELNTPGLLLSLLTLCVLLLAIFLFPSQSELEGEKEKVVSAQRVLDAQAHKEELPSRVILTGVILFIALNAVVRGIIALIETVATPVFLDAWDDFRTEPINPVRDTSWMLLGLGCIGLLVILATPWMAKRMKEPFLLSFSFLIMGFGAILLIDYSKKQEGLNLVQFLIGAALIWSLGSPISQTIIISTFSKLLGTKPQGTMMGWISAAGSVGRIVLPLLSSVLGTKVSLIVSAVLALVCSTAPVFFLRLRDASHRRSYYREPYSAPPLIL